MRCRTDVKRSIGIGSRASGIKTPLQFTKLNAMGASCDRFDVPMDIYQGKYNYKSRESAVTLT